MTIKKKGILIVGLLLIAAIIATILYNPKSPVSEEHGTSSINTPSTAKLNVYKIENGWGYEILVDSKVFIYQESIPGLPSNVKFISKSDAKKCGELVLEKLTDGKIPYISKSELDSLQISY